MSYRDEKPELGSIAISAGALAIFGSRLGFLGPVIQNYEPFENEAKAIEEAKAKIAELGLPLDPEIIRPRITKMIVTYGKRRPATSSRGLEPI